MMIETVLYRDDLSASFKAYFLQTTVLMEMIELRAIVPIRARCASTATVVGRAPYVELFHTN